MPEPYQYVPHDAFRSIKMQNMILGFSAQDKYRVRQALNTGYIRGLVEIDKIKAEMLSPKGR